LVGGGSAVNENRRSLLRSYNRRTVRGAVVEGVLLAFDGSCEVGIVAELVGDAEVGLLDAGEHFLIESLPKWLARLEDGVGVGVFAIEVAGDFGIFFLA